MADNLLSLSSAQYLFMLTLLICVTSEVQIMEGYQKAKIKMTSHNKCTKLALKSETLACKYSNVQKCQRSTQLIYLEKIRPHFLLL